MSLNKYGTGVIEDKEGNKYHLINGKLNSEDDNPSVEFANGDMLWHKDGLLHRENAPAAIIGTRFLYCLNGTTYEYPEYSEIIKQKKKSKKRLDILKQLYTISLFILFPNFIIFLLLDLFQITNDTCAVPFILQVTIVLLKTLIVETNYDKNYKPL